MTQDEALDILKLGHGAFLTGPAGSGKTYVLNQYISYLRERGVGVALTASTGIAATHIGGQTIHSWSGIGIKDSLSDYDLDRLESRKSLFERYKKTEVLVIDEISMLSAGQMDMVDTIARHMRRRTAEPFGGMQVIVTGDFFQLPPVTKNGSPEYAFESRAWKEAKPVVCYLETQFRQDDERLLDILENIRKRNISGGVHEHLKARFREDSGEEEIDVADEAGERTTTRLFTHNIDVDALNEKELEKLDTDSRTFEMKKTKGSKANVENLVKNCLAPEYLTLKIDAKVMCVKNDPAGRYVNGTLGVVKKLSADEVEIQTNSGRTLSIAPVDWNFESDGSVKATITQIPLRLAWAITVHKSQGMTLDSAEIDLSKTFAPGQGYVALSRVRSLETLFLKGFNDVALQVEPKVARFDEELRVRSEHARERLENIEKGELLERQKEFITQSGGKEPDPKKKKKEREKSGESKIDDLKTPEEKARDKEERSRRWQERLEKMRETYPNAYKKWTDEDDERLAKEFEKSEEIEPLTEKFGRHPGSIRARLVKLELIEEGET